MFAFDYIVQYSISLAPCSCPMSSPLCCTWVIICRRCCLSFPLCPMIDGRCIKNTDEIMYVLGMNHYRWWEVVPKHPLRKKTLKVIRCTDDIFVDECVKPSAVTLDYGRHHIPSMYDQTPPLCGEFFVADCNWWKSVNFKSRGHPFALCVLGIITVQRSH